MGELRHRFEWNYLGDELSSFESEAGSRCFLRGEAERSPGKTDERSNSEMSNVEVITGVGEWV